MTVSINKINDDIRQEIINDYKNGKSLRKIEEEYGVTRSTVSKYLSKIGIKTTTGNHFRSYFHQEDYFNTIDTEAKAYWLGFMFADGYIVDNEDKYGQDQFGLSVAEKDIEILENFKRDLKATNPIHIYKRNPPIKGQPLCRLQLTSQQTVNDLINHGCVKQKSHILLPPIGLSNEFIPHFIRGFFDGDGSIIKSKNNNYKKTDGYVYSINFTTTQEMANWLQSYFNMGSVVKESRKDSTYYYSFGGH